LAAGFVQQFLGDEPIKYTFNHALAGALPSMPVQVGDRWESSATETVGAAVAKITGRYKLASIDQVEGHEIANIEFTTSANLDGNAPRSGKIKTGRLDEKGTKQFDVTRGYFRQTDKEQVISAEIAIPGPKGEIVLTLENVKKSKITISPANEK
jgi:hypothetical protein